MMKKLILILLLLNTVVALNLDVQPNYIRALPKESLELTVTITADSSGFYTLGVNGPEIDFEDQYELIPQQSMPVRVPVTAPSESGEHIIQITLKHNQQEVSAQSILEVVEESEQSHQVNETLHQTRDELNQLLSRAQPLTDPEISSKLSEAETLLNMANNSYQSGYLNSAQSELEQTKTKLRQATTLIELAEKSRWNINLELLAIGVLIILIAFFLTQYPKLP